MMIEMEVEMMKKVKNQENNSIIKIKNQRRKMKMKKIRRKDNQAKMQIQKVTVN
jgi:hypothetical protein